MPVHRWICVLSCVFAACSAVDKGAGKAVVVEPVAVPRPKPPVLPPKPAVDPAERGVVKLIGHWDVLTSAAVTADGKVAVTGSADQTARLWDLAKGKETARLSGHLQPVSAVALSADGTRALTGSNDKTLRLWDLKTGRSLRELRGHQRLVSSLAFSIDGKRAASGDAGGVVKVWDLTTGKLLKSIEAHRKTVNQVLFTGDGKQLVSAGDDRTAVLWDTASGKPLRRFIGHKGWVTSAALSPDGGRLATGSADRTVRLWDVKTGRQLQVLTWPVTNSAALVSRVAFARHGDLVVGSGGTSDAAPDPATVDFSIRVWDTATGAELARFSGHKGAVVALKALNDDVLVSVATDETARLWELPPPAKTPHSH